MVFIQISIRGTETGMCVINIYTLPPDREARVITGCINKMYVPALQTFSSSTITFVLPEPCNMVC